MTWYLLGGVEDGGEGGEGVLDRVLTLFRPGFFGSFQTGGGGGEDSAPP